MYSFHCNFCGYTFFGSKYQVQEVRTFHRTPIRFLGKFCPTRLTKFGTRVRPDLLDYINSIERTVDYNDKGHGYLHA